MTLHFRLCNGFPQIFKLEVPKHRILHGMPDALQTGQRRLKLTFAQVPCALLPLRLFSFSILLKEIRYSLTIVDDNDMVVYLCSFRF